MHIFSALDTLPAFREPVVTVGSFDGVHLGHAHLLGIMKDRAEASGGETIVVTFARHPRSVLQASDDVKLLTSLSEKALLLEQNGIDNLVVMPFDDATSRLAPEEFLHNFLIGRLGAKELVVGYNHRFGHDKKGDAAMLKDLEEKYGFMVHEASKFAAGNDKISSTTIRKAVSVGDMKRAGRMSGHPYIIEATVGGHGELMTDEPLKLFPPEGRYYVTANGANGIFTVGSDGGVTLETAVPPAPGTRLSISF